MNLRLFLMSRRAFWGGAVFLMVAEVLASWLRSQILPDVAYFRVGGLWVALSLGKGLLFGPILGVLSGRIYRFWKQNRWDEACFLALRGGFTLGATQIVFALGCFLGRSHFPRLLWMSSSWPHFAVWLTLNVALLWALLLLIAGFLLPSDARKTVQVSESLRF